MRSEYKILRIRYRDSKLMEWPSMYSLNDSYKKQIINSLWSNAIKANRHSFRLLSIGRKQIFHLSKVENLLIRLNLLSLSKSWNLRLRSNQLNNLNSPNIFLVRFHLKMMMKMINLMLRISPKKNLYSKITKG